MLQTMTDAGAAAAAPGWAMVPMETGMTDMTEIPSERARRVARERAPQEAVQLDEYLRSRGGRPEDVARLIERVTGLDRATWEALLEAGRQQP